ncbi:formylmethanofuran dehydrogenase subunit C (plasmid) [Azospirillum humicireducens]|uniref:Formylmethanofuran dehydrogenase subunit C n=1 Tax=Azospirillum humicireducens TaxID=1226968 RepID=A0A2R4VRN1_9PROT|nr:formylmethanofuran dehydrogenase subunit C [Azospirillum humicireducens]AWB07072.1 formylmethanofuran dehydrogenase subunit C [Azospirillum humicireducens]
MSVLSFRLKGPLTGRVDASPLLPHRLAELDMAEIAALPLRHGRGHVAVGDLFELSGRPGDVVELEGDGRLDFVGAGLTAGTIRVAGPVGHRVGTGMSGGTLVVDGAAGLAAGAAMRGGLLFIGGNAGDGLGGALPGERTGMTGGRILVHGRCGDRVGERMRRGLIAVGGDAGAYAALHMNAGSLVIGGTPGPATGHGMRNGTVLFRGEVDPLPGFADCGLNQLPFLSLLDNHLSELEGVPPTCRGLTGRARRWLGDRGFGGRGELLACL